MPVSRFKALFPNPFYVLLLVISTLFVVTTLAYLVAPSVATNPRDDRLAGWLDKNGPWLLGAECVGMVVFGLLAMATDRWFPEKPERG